MIITRINFPRTHTALRVASKAVGIHDDATMPERFEVDDRFKPHMVAIETFFHDITDNDEFHSICEGSEEVIRNYLSPEIEGSRSAIALLSSYVLRTPPTK